MSTSGNNIDKRDPGQEAKNIQAMFGAIANRYDLLNRVLSMGIDIYWRKRCIRAMTRASSNLSPVLDLAAGTGDLSLAYERTHPETRIVAADFSIEMLRNFKVKTPPQSRIRIIAADGRALPFAPDTFGGVMIGFGIRNFTEREKGLNEIRRVLKPGGILAILEFSMPTNRILRGLYTFYFEKILPFIGGLLSRRSAYQYLPESVKTFPDPATFSTLLETCQFRLIQRKPLTGGIATLYIARKISTDPSGKNR